MFALGYEGSPPGIARNSFRGREKWRRRQLNIFENASPITKPPGGRHTRAHITKREHASRSSTPTGGRNDNFVGHLRS